MAGNRKTRGKNGPRSARGLGSVHWDEQRKRWTAERWVRLADGTKKRIRARDPDQATAIEKLEAKAKVAELETLETSALTLNRMLDEWLAALKPTLATSSYNDYEATMRLHVRPLIGGLMAARVDGDDIAGVLAKLMLTDPPKVATAHKVRRLLSQAFIWAVKRRKVTANPVQLVDTIKRRTAPPQAWTAEEARAFLEAAEGDPLYALFYTALATGMRKGELLALRWSDVRGDTIIVQRTVSKGADGGVKEGAKTIEGNRRIPVSPDLARVLETQRAVAAASHTPELVFVSSTRGRLSGRHVSGRLHEIAKAAGVPDIRFHDLRKTTASLWARQGVAPAVIQALLGHATPDLALRVYTRVYAEDLKRAALDLTALGGVRGGQRGGLPSEHDHTPTRRRPGSLKRTGATQTRRTRSRR